MYQVPQGYPYMQTIDRESNESFNEAILEGIKKKEEAVDLFRRLADLSPDEAHQQEILHVLDNEQRHLDHFTNLYNTFTGEKPEYEVQQASFDTFEEGLRKGYDAGVGEFQNYQDMYMQARQHVLGNVFYRACHDKMVTTNRLVAISRGEGRVVLKDYGNNPFVVDIEEVTKQNRTFRTALWTGEHLQVTLMSIAVGEDIGLEVHPDVDQFLRVEQGQGLVQMGDRRDQLDFQQRVADDYAIMVPAGKWHNLTNTGQRPLKIYSIYAPPEHPFGTVHKTKAEAMATENGES
ncbi:Mannose-6-phosphate isomerase, cupin superfamily [Halobacillus dabanensis]|uniref:Mannose-6-phosphate isomerase, cupin superfamily n=1 Tax=Halobacillus dabanensis TaxID=240302 RepID=A0A1I3Q135_HALDA|nr:cupin domain-containing protein [Halobacillus dabanensis]SFJ27187.1 Mannose-6-phosphate isomerase, cupin superfamily [Halobacillus dabanensis]